MQGKGDDDNSAQLGLANLGGVFIVLAAGVIISCFLAVAEFMWESRGIVQDRNVRLNQLFILVYAIYIY